MSTADEVTWALWDRLRAREMYWNICQLQTGARASTACSGMASFNAKHSGKHTNPRGNCGRWKLYAEPAM